MWKPGDMVPRAVVVRVAAAPGDLDGIGKIDASYSTDRIYRVRRGELGFWLDEERVSPPLQKTYSRAEPELSDRLLVASAGTEIVGYGSCGLIPGAGGRRSKVLLCQLVSGARAWSVRLSRRWTSMPARSLPRAACGWRPRTSTIRRSSSTGAWDFGCAGWMRRSTGPDVPGLLPGEVAIYFARDLA